MFTFLFPTCLHLKSTKRKSVRWSMGTVIKKSWKIDASQKSSGQCKRIIRNSSHANEFPSEMKKNKLCFLDIQLGHSSRLQRPNTNEGLEKMSRITNTTMENLVTVIRPISSSAAVKVLEEKSKCYPQSRFTVMKRKFWNGKFGCRNNRTKRKKTEPE